MNAFFESLRDFLVIECVAGRVHEAAAVSDGDAAPGVEQSVPLGGFSRAEGASVGEELFGGFLFLFAPAFAHLTLAALFHELLVALQEFSDLDNVIGKRFRGGVDGGEAAADHHNGHADLEVGDRIALSGSRELQSHEEIGGLADAASEAVGHGDDGGTSGAGAKGDVIETEIEGAIDGNGAAEADAAIHGEFAAALNQKARDFQEILVPSDGDAVFGDAAETCHHAVVERFVNLENITDGAEGNALARGFDAGDFGGERLDFQSINADDGVTVVH